MQDDGHLRFGPYELDPGGRSLLAHGRPIALLLLGRTDRLEAQLVAAEASERGSFFDAYPLAVLGRTEDALRVLDPGQMMLADHHYRFQYDPVWDPVRARPAFRAVLRTHGTTELHDRAQAWRATRPRPGDPDQ